MPFRRFYFGLIAVVLATFAVAARAALDSAAPSGQRLLAILSTDADHTRFAPFFAALVARGHIVEYALASKTPSIESFNHLIHLAPGVPLDGPLAPPRIIEFMRGGGNVFMATDESMTDSHVRLAGQFGMSFDPSGGALVLPAEPSKQANDTAGRMQWSPVIKVVRGITAPHGLVPKKHDSRRLPAIYQGIGHHVLARRAHSGGYLPVLHAPALARASASPVGVQPRLVSAFQASNNARFAIIGSLLALDHEWVAETCKFLGIPEAANSGLWTELTKWVFREKAVVRLLESRYENLNGASEYRINDKMVYTADLQEYEDGVWRPFRTSKLQLSVKMIDPYIRRTLPPMTTISGPDGQVARYSIKLQLPDVYGVFTFGLALKERGYTFVERNDRVPIMPPLHDSYPRYLPVAYPYYIATFAQIAALVIFSTLWMVLRESDPKLDSGSGPIKIKNKGKGKDPRMQD